MLCDMWNYAPLASGLHMLLSICPHWKKSHEVSINKADRPHVFLYQYYLQALVSHVHPEVLRRRCSFHLCTLALGQHPPLAFN